MAQNNTVRNSVQFVCKEDQQTWPENKYLLNHKYTAMTGTRCYGQEEDILQDMFRHFAGSTLS